MSTAAPQYMPTYELNQAVTLKAESIRLRVRAVDDQAARVRRRDGVLGPQPRVVHAHGGPRRRSTERIKLYASTATLTLPPAIVARMAVTIDSIGAGRFGVNIVTGWQKGRVRPDGPVAGGRSTAATRYEQSSGVRAASCATCGRPGAATSRASSSTWRTATWARSRRDRSRSSAPARATAGMQFSRRVRRRATSSSAAAVNTPTAHAPGQRATGVAAQRSRPRRRRLRPVHGHRGRDRRGGLRASGTRYNDGVDREAIATMTGRRGDRHAPTSAATTRQHRDARGRDQLQHGDARRLLRDGRRDARRGGRRAGHQGDHADLRRLPRRASRSSATHIQPRMASRPEHR